MPGTHMGGGCGARWRTPDVREHTLAVSLPQALVQRLASLWKRAAVCAQETHGRAVRPHEYWCLVGVQRGVMRSRTTDGTNHTAKTIAIQRIRERSSGAPYTDFSI